MERIETLAEMWVQKAPTPSLPITAPVSPKWRQRTCLCQAWNIYKRFWILLYNRPSDYLFEALLALILSVIVGFVFYEIPTNQRAGIDDRFGVLFSVLCLVTCPLTALSTQQIFNERRLLYMDGVNRNYGSFLYIIIKFVFDLPFATFASILLSIPVYLIVRLNPTTYDNLAALCLFIVVVTANTLFLRYLSWCPAYFFRERFTVTATQLIVLTLLALSSGFLFHPEDQNSTLKWISTLNPMRISGQILVESTFLSSNPWLERTEMLMGTTRTSANGSATQLQFECLRKQVLAPKIALPIYTVSQCLRTTGEEVYRTSGFNISIMTSSERQMHYSNSAMIWMGWMGATFILLLFCAQRIHKPPPDLLYF
ncbi:hypothetical protein L596_002727 [Steinernema carpocapsae]|nr:hypothetical protein L596_002727 [Steinernema carpocapsae]